jgi:sporulation protein YlmC with PRC-barrel domain
VDEGYPIAYEVLEKGVPVYASDGGQVGTVHHVVAAPEKDIFHGLVITVPGSGRRFVEAADVESLHERGVDLRIDSVAAGSLSAPGGGAAVFTDAPNAMARGWSHWVERWVGGRGDWRRER